MQERISEAFAGTEQLSVLGRQLQVGDPAPDFRLEYLDLADQAIRTVGLADSAGMVRLLSVVNTLERPLCQRVTRQWEALCATLPPDACIYTVSMDSPQMQAHWQDTVGVLHQVLSAQHSDTRSLHTHLDKEKETMSSTTLYRVSGISLLLGALVGLIAALLAFFVNTSFTAPPATFQSPLWSTHYSLFFASIALTLIGLPALYLRLRGQRGDRLGFFGLLFIVLGGFLAVGMAGYFVSVLPVVATKAPQILTATLVDSSFSIFPLGGTLFSTIGTILLGIAVLRAKVFPALVGILLLAWTVLNLLGFVFQSGLLVTFVGLLSALAWAAAYGWVGVMLVQQHTVLAGDKRSSVQTALR